MHHLLKCLLVALTLIPAAAGRSPAQEFGPPEGVLQAAFLPGWQNRDGSYTAAISLTLAPGWKTYWRAPGDAGIPPEFDWQGSRNIAGVGITWPRPSVFLTSGYRTIGYQGDVIFPLLVRPKSPGAPIRVETTLRIGVCEDICVPATVRLSATLAGPGASDPAIHAALAQRPVPGKRAGVKGVTCTVEPISDGLRLTARVAMPRLGNEVAVIEAGDPRIWVSEATTTRDGGTLTAVADLVPPKGGGIAFSRDKVRITVLGSRQAVDIRGCSSG